MAMFIVFIKYYQKATYTLLIYTFYCNNFVSVKETDKLQKEFLVALGNKIREIRIEKGLSQSEVAHLCGKERQSYQRVEKGNINPTAWYLHHIAMALKVDLKDLFNVEFPEIKLENI